MSRFVLLIHVPLINASCALDSFQLVDFYYSKILSFVFDFRYLDSSFELIFILFFFCDTHF